MKTLIINGSPRKKGDTFELLSELKKHLDGEIIEISAYYDNIKPCIDCRYCWKKKGCKINADDMQKVYKDDFDIVVIASPIYMKNLTGPLISLASRFQAYYAAKRFLKDEMYIKEKDAMLIIVGGGDGKPDPAIELAKLMFKKMEAKFNDEDIVSSLHTDDVPAKDDVNALLKIREIAYLFNEKYAHEKCE